MSHSEYLSSPKIIFSDRGSIMFGFLIILAMVAVSLIFLFCKFQKTAPSPKNNFTNRRGAKHLLLLKHPYLFRSSKLNYLLFFMNNRKVKVKNAPQIPYQSSVFSTQVSSQ